MLKTGSWLLMTSSTTLSNHTAITTVISKNKDLRICFSKKKKKIQLMLEKFCLVISFSSFWV